MSLLVSSVRAVCRLGWRMRGQEVFTIAPTHPLLLCFVRWVLRKEVNELVQVISCKRLRDKPVCLLGAKLSHVLCLLDNAVLNFHLCYTGVKNIRT